LHFVHEVRSLHAEQLVPASQLGRTSHLPTLLMEVQNWPAGHVTPAHTSLQSPTSQEPPVPGAPALPSGPGTTIDPPLPPKPQVLPPDPPLPGVELSVKQPNPCTTTTGNTKRMAIRIGSARTSRA
jgi:hypothetical protein